MVTIFPVPNLHLVNVQRENAGKMFTNSKTLQLEGDKQPASQSCNINFNSN
jgi:hypothetical protein